MNRAELTLAIQGAIADLIQAQAELGAAACEWAAGENAYNRAQSEAFIRLSAVEGKQTVAEKQARVDAACADERFARDLAEARRDVAKVVVRNCQAILSAYQTLAGLEKSEADALRFSQHAGA